MNNEYELIFDVSIRQLGAGYGQLSVRNNFTVKAEDLLAVMRMLAELEAYTRKLAKPDK